MRTLSVRLLAALVMAAATAAPAQSIISEGGSSAHMALLAGGPGPAGTRHAGLEIVLDAGWKTYWRSPGSAGVPPRFDWSGSRNLRRVEVLWPRPVLFESFGLRTVGYEGRVVLPFRIVPDDPEKPVALALTARIGVCNRICIVETAHLSLRLPPGAGEGNPGVAAALARVPATGAEVGVVAFSCRFEGTGAARRLIATLTFADPPRAPVVLLEAPGGAWFGPVETEGRGSQLDVRARLETGGAPWIARDAIRMTVLGAGGYAADIRGCG